MKKIEFASSVAVHQLQTEVDEVILAIAPFMIEPGEDAEEWAGSVFVSDESSIGDFLNSTSELGPLAERLGLPALQMRDLIRDVAETLRQKKKPN